MGREGENLKESERWEKRAKERQATSQSGEETKKQPALLRSPNSISHVNHFTIEGHEAVMLCSPDILSLPTLLKDETESSSSNTHCTQNIRRNPMNKHTEILSSRVVSLFFDSDSFPFGVLPCFDSLLEENRCLTIVVDSMLTIASGCQ